MNRLMRSTGPLLTLVVLALMVVGWAWAGSGRSRMQQEDAPLASGESADTEPSGGIVAPRDPEAGGAGYEYRPVGELPDWIAPVDATSVNPLAGHRILVESSRVRKRSEAAAEMWLGAEQRVSDYLNEKIAAGAGTALAVDRNDIRNRLVSNGPHVHIWLTPSPLHRSDNDEDEFLEWYRSSVELTLDRRFDEWATARYEEHMIQSRVLQTALFVLSGVALLGIVYGFLHLNHRTRGFYSGRLQTVSLIAALVVVVLALALSNSFAWL